MTREQLTTYLDGLDRPITGENIGQIRRSLMMPFDCEWNAWVRDETAAREKHIPEPGESSGFHEFRVKVLQNTVKSLNEQIEGLRLELAHVTRHRDFLEGELHKRDEQLDSVKIERDAAEKRAESFHTSTVNMAREIQLLQAHLQDVCERNVSLRAHKVAAENELRKTRQELLECGKSRVEQMTKNVDLENKLNCLNVYIPREITALRKFSFRAVERAFREYPVMEQEWQGLGHSYRDFFYTLIFRVFEFLPQLDVTTTCHPAGASESGNRNSVDPHSERQSNSENGQTSIASEDSTTPPVSGQPS